MSETLRRIRELVRTGRFRVSYHGDEELLDDRISSREAVDGVESAQVIEEYGDTGRGPSVLVLQRISDGSLIHAVWGIAFNRLAGPAVLVTAYRPDPAKWTDDLLQRKK